MHGWLTVAKKDLREMWRDKRVLIGVFVMPLFVMAVFVSMFGVIESTFKKAPDVKIGVVGAEDDAVVKRLTSGATTRLSVRQFRSVEEATPQLENGDLKLVVAFGPGWRAAVAKGEALVTLHYDQTAAMSQMAAALVKRKVEEENLARAQEALRRAGEDPGLARPIKTKELNTSKAKGLGASTFAGLLPYLIVLFAFTAAASSAADLVAGEKERGTMEALLVSPPHRTALAVGKLASLSLVSLVGGLVAVLSLLLVGVLHVPGTQVVFPKGVVLPLDSVVVMLGLLVPLAVMYAGTMLAVSAAARSMREAQSYLAVMNLFVMAPAVASQVVGVTGMEKAAWVAWVPVLNTAIGLKNALGGQADWGLFLASVASCVAVGAVGIALAVRSFGREGFLRRV